MSKMENENIQVLLKMYEESMIQRRHHETSRTTLSNILIAIDAVLIGLIVDNGVEKTDLWLVLLLMYFSIFGILSSISFLERYNLYWRRSRVFREKIDLVMDNTMIKDAIKDEKTYEDPEEKRWPRTICNCFRHHVLWCWLHIPILIFSIVFIIKILIDFIPNIQNIIIVNVNN